MEQIMKTKRIMQRFILMVVLVLGTMLAMSMPAYAALDNTLQAETDASGPNWAWDGTAKTLTLSGASLGSVKIETDATLLLAEGTKNTISGTGINSAFEVQALTVEGSGELTIVNAGTNNSNYGIKANGNLTINNGTISATAGTIQNSGRESTGILTLGDFTINGGTVTAIGNTAKGRSFGIRVDQGKNLTISGEDTVVNVQSGTANQHSFGIANSGINPDGDANGGIMTINGGAINVTGGDSIGSNPAEGIFVRKGGRLLLKGGHVTVKSGNASNNNSYAFRSMGNLEISGGVLEAIAGQSSGTKDTMNRSYAIYAGNNSATDYGQITITGGMISASANSDSMVPAAIQADGGIIMNAEDPRLTVFNQADGESFVSGETNSMHQQEYTKPLKIGAVPFYITLENDGRGTASVADPKQAYFNDNTIELTATPNTGYEFNYWTVNGEKREALDRATASYKVNAEDGDAVIKAFFKPQPLLTKVEIDGDRTIGSTLKAVITPEQAEDVTYQWYKDGQLIEGQTGETYDVTTKDLNSKITVKAVQYGTDVEVSTKLEDTPPITGNNGLILVAGTDQSGDGWNWDGTNKVLTLNGANIDGYVWISTAATIQVIDGTTNSISGGYTSTAIKGASTHGSATGIYCSENLTIKGTGTLNVTSTDNSQYKDQSPSAAGKGGVQRIYGIYSVGDLKISETKLSSVAGSTTYVTTSAVEDGSFGIYCGGNMEVDGGADVTAKGGHALNSTNNGAASMGIVVADGKSMTISGDTTKLHAEASDARASSYGIKGGTGNVDKSKTGIDLTINGGSVTAIGAKTTKNSNAVASEGIFVGDRGSLVLNNGTVYCKSGEAVYGSYAFRCRGNLEINGGVLTVEAGNSQKNGSYGIYAGSDTSVSYGYGSIKITGGHIESLADNTAYDKAAIRAENGITMQLGEGQAVFNQDSTETFVSGTTKAMHQEDYSKPLKIGLVPFTVTVENDERGEAFITEPKETYYNGESVSLKATPKEGYELNYWSVNGKKRESLSSANVSYNVNANDGDAVIKAFFKPKHLLTKIEIEGERKVGSTLTAVITPEQAEDVTYQWYKDGQPIEGQTGTTYEVPEEDLNSKITVKAVQYGTEAEVSTRLEDTPPIEEPGPETVTAYVVRQGVDATWTNEGAESQIVPATYQAAADPEGFHLSGYSLGDYKAAPTDRTAATAGTNIDAGEGPLWLYYSRDQYQLTFYSDTEGTNVWKTETVYYGASIKQYKSEAIPDRENDTFADWATEKGIIVDSYKDKAGNLNKDLEGKLVAWDEPMTANKEVYPIWIHDRLAVVIDTGANDVSLDQEQGTSFTVNLDEKVTMRYLIAATRPGYELAGWYTQGGVLWNGDNWENLDYVQEGWVETAGWGVTPTYCDKKDGTDYIQVDNVRKFKFYTVTLTAHWTPVKVGVRYDLKGGTGEITDSNKYGLGDDITVSKAVPATLPADLPATTEDEYWAFNGWTIGNDSTPHSPGETFMFNDWNLVENGELVLKAQYIEKPKLAVTFDTQGGTAVAPVKVQEGATIETAPATEKTGHTFDGWYNGENKATFPYEVSGATTLTAYWSINQYTLKIDPMNGTAATESLVKYGEAIKAPAEPQRTHFDFDGWSPAIPSTMPAANTTIKANWKPTVYKISFDTAGGSEVADIEDIYGASVTVPADPEKDNCVFVGWKNTEGKIVSLPAYMPDTNPKYTAAWKENQKKPTAPETENVTQTSIKIKDPDNGQEYSADGGNTWVLYEGEGDMIFNNLTPGTTYHVVTRIPGSDTKMPSPDSETAEVTTLKYSQEKPADPSVKATGPKTIAVKPAYEAEEYVIVKKSEAPADPKNLNWTEAKTAKDGSAVFENLEPDAEYYVYARKKETGTQDPSPAAGPVEVNTPTNDLSDAEITLQKDELAYTGSETGPTIVKVMLNGIVLTEEKDYEVTTESKKTAPGEYSLTIKGKGEYNDQTTATQAWKILKGTPELGGELTLNPITYGQKLEDSRISGTMKFGETEVAGTFSWKEPETKPEVSDSNKTEFEIVFTPANNDTYETVTLKAKLTVNKAGQGKPADPEVISEATDSVTITNAIKGVTYTLKDAEGEVVAEVEAEEDGKLVIDNTFTAEGNEIKEGTTYTVTAQRIGDINHNASEPSKSVSITTKRNAVDPDPQPEPEPEPEHYTVPVTNEDQVNVNVEIKDGNAVVEEIKQSDIDQITGDGTTQATVDTISIDLSGATQEVTAVELTKSSVENLAVVIADDNGIDSVTIQMTSAIVTLDADTLKAVVAQAKGDNIKLVVDDFEKEKLNKEQKKAIEQFKSAEPFEAYFESNGERIHNFKGGKAIVGLEFTPAKGTDVNHYHLMYLNPDGTLEKFPTWLKAGWIYSELTHFSEYAIVYDEKATNESGDPSHVTYDDLTDTEKADADKLAASYNTDKETAAKMLRTGQSLGVSMDTMLLSTGAIEALPNDEDPAGTDFSKLRAKAVKRGKTTMRLQWTAQSNADGYLIYSNKCGKTCKLKKTIKSGKITKWNRKKLKKATYYKYIVVAYKTVGDQKLPIAASVFVHCTTKAKKSTIAKGVKMNKKKVTLAVGATAKIRGKEIKAEKKKIIKKHRVVLYESLNPEIATVNKRTGKITGVSAGTTKIYVYAQNGVYKKVPVTVQ